MIFVSLGTMDMPFIRMAKAVDNLAKRCNDEVIVQTGYTDYKYKYAKSFDFCTKQEMAEYIDKADILILQGGWGAISEAMAKNKKILAMPRHNKTEHIHDQFQLVKKLDALGCVIGVFDENELQHKITLADKFDFNKLEKGKSEDILRANLKEWFS